MDKYSETLRDHCRHPRNRDPVGKPDAIGMTSLHGHAPHVVMYLYVNEGKIADARFQATGCGVAIACASALTELVIGLSVAACSQIDIAKLVQALDGIPLDKRFCADLAIEALRQALTRLDTGDSMGI